jgi:hypothetical protein
MKVSLNACLSELREGGFETRTILKDLMLDIKMFLVSAFISSSRDSSQSMPSS